MGSSSKNGFGDINQPKNTQPYTDQNTEVIKFEAFKMHQKNRLDKAISFIKLIKYGIKDTEVFINLYQIYKKQKNSRFIHNLQKDNQETNLTIQK